MTLPRMRVGAGTCGSLGGNVPSRSFVFYDGAPSYLFYATGDMRNSEVYIDALHGHDFEAASRAALDRGQGYAVGPCPGN